MGLRARRTAYLPGIMRVFRSGWAMEQLLCRNGKQFRGGLVFKAHGLVYHSTLGSEVIKKKKVGHRRQEAFDLSER